MKRNFAVIVLAALGAAAGGWACTSHLGQEDDGKDSEPVVGASAGGITNIISDGWDDALVPKGNNLKMLKFSQMRSEVLRATGVTWAGWEANRAVFGAPDFENTFQHNRAPSASKLIVWRKMAFSVCETMITRETAMPALFTSIAPTAAIAPTDPKVAAQITAIFIKFFLDEPNTSALDLSQKALMDSISAGANPSEAWRNLCVGYLSSMRFLVY